VRVILGADESAMEDSLTDHRRMFEALRADDGRKPHRGLEAEKRHASDWLAKNYVDATREPLRAGLS
jgi:hypothetical protein